MFGNAGHDTLFGDGGNDAMAGNNGTSDDNTSDTLDGGAGTDSNLFVESGDTVNL